MELVSHEKHTHQSYYDTKLAGWQTNADSPEFRNVEMDIHVGLCQDRLLARKKIDEDVVREMVCAGSFVVKDVQA